MNERELAEFLPNVAEYIDGTSHFGELLPALPGTSHGAWELRFGPAHMVLHIHKNAALAITAALALGVPYSHEVSHHINDLNASVLTVGRMFIKEFEGTGRGAIAMQEIVYCQDMEGAPSMNTLLRIIGKVGGIAQRLSPELCRRYGAHPPADEAGLLVLSLE